MVSSYNKAIIHRCALQSNLHYIKSLAPDSNILAMVKANAYGHGLIETATTLTSADGFGVASFAEAMTLRNAGIQQPIVIMSAILTADEYMLAVTHDFSVVLHNIDQLNLLESLSLKSTLNVWLMLDSGMHRLGILPDQIEEVYQRLIHIQKVHKPICLMTHLSDADNVNKPETQQQINCFLGRCDKSNIIMSIGNSAGIMAWPKSRSDWIRPGIMLYGVYPLLGEPPAKMALKPAMTLKSKLITVRHLPKNAKVGYAGTWTCPEAMPVGIVGIGYGDGYPRHATNGTPVLVNGVRCPLVGRVSMDMIAVDLRAHPNAQVEDDVELWGKQLSVSEVAEHASTIAYDLLCGITKRVNVQFED